MEPSLELQKAIRLRLVASSMLTALVPASSILDKNARPVPFPSIIIGEGQTIPASSIARNRHEVFFDLHVWATETGVTTSKQITGAIRSALADTVWTVTGLHVGDLHITSTRFLRNPDGLHSHGIVSVRANVVEVA